MKYEILESKQFPGEWVVEAINEDEKGDGEIYLTVFSYARAEQRARAYLNWVLGIPDSQCKFAFGCE